MSKLIVHIIDRMPPDGAERLLVEVLHHRDSTLDYHLLCLVEGGSLIAEVEALGIPCTILCKKPGFDLLHAWELYRWLQRKQPGIVHTHLFTADTWGRLCAWLAGVPGIFATVHSANTWKTRVHLTIDRLLARVSTRVIACSDTVETTLLQQRLPRSTVVSIPNGVDLQRISTARPVDLQRAFSLPPGQPVFALVGRLHPAKGHADLLPALHELWQAGHRFSVLFVGEGELDSELKASVAALGLSDCVHFTGFRDDVIGILKSIDFLLMPSRWEGLPLTLLESMACGTPALASRVGGIPDVIDNGCNGMLFDSGDTATLVQCLLQILQGWPADSDMPSAARRTVEQRFSAALVAAAYEALYAEVL